MELTNEMIDYLHNEGRIPDWAYYQINGKSINENYLAQKKQINDLFQKTARGIKLFEERRKKEIDAEIISEAENQLPNIIQGVLDTILDGI